MERRKKRTAAGLELTALGVNFILLSFLLECAMLLASSPLWILLFASNGYLISRNYADTKACLNKTWITVLVVGVEILLAVLLMAAFGFPACQRMKPYL